MLADIRITADKTVSASALGIFIFFCEIHFPKQLLQLYFLVNIFCFQYVQIVFHLSECKNLI